MSILATNAITDASGGNTATINGYTPTMSNMAGRNKIINGNFDIWQRGTFFSGIAYTADRWYQTWNGTGTTRATSYQNSDQSLWGDFSRFVRVANTGAPTGQTFNKFVQRIEYVTTLADKTITVSFKAKSSSASTLSVTLEQNFGSGGSTAVTVDPSFSEVLTSDWVTYSFTVALPSISGKTVGSSHYLELTFNLPLNSTFEIDIAQVQLEAGSVATPFEHVDYGKMLRRCQRYYYRQNTADENGNFTVFGWGHAYGTSVINITVNFPVSMRTYPSTLDTSAMSTFQYERGNTTATTPTSITINANTNSSWMGAIDVNKSAAFSNGASYKLQAAGTNTAYLGFGAEL